jgi:hypothetical protein
LQWISCNGLVALGACLLYWRIAAFARLAYSMFLDPWQWISSTWLMSVVPAHTAFVRLAFRNGQASVTSVVDLYTSVTSPTSHHHHAPSHRISSHLTSAVDPSAGIRLKDKISEILNRRPLSSHCGCLAQNRAEESLNPSFRKLHGYTTKH